MESVMQLLSSKNHKYMLDQREKYLTKNADKRHLKMEPKYTVFEESNLSFTEWEMQRFLEGWVNGEPIWDIAETMKRPQLEAFLLSVDFSMRGIIQERKGGILGSKGR